MIKKILGEAPFDVFCEKLENIVPGKHAAARFVFVNDTEYDLPLSVSIVLSSLAKLNKTNFDLVVPAQGKTVQDLTFSLDKHSKIFSGTTVCDIKIIDGVLDSESDYELVLNTEMAFKCEETHSSAFVASEQTLYTKDGVFFANKNEYICLEIPCLAEKDIGIDGTNIEQSVYLNDKPVCDTKNIRLIQGLNRLCIRLSEDGSFVLTDSNSGEKIYLDTLNPKYFLED